MITGFAARDSGSASGPCPLKYENMRKFKAFILLMLATTVLVLAAAAGYAWHWVQAAVDMNAERVQYVVEPGSGVRAIARAMNAAGIQVNADGLTVLARVSGLDKQIKAGAYEAQRGDTPQRLLERMARGEMVQSRLTLVEGWTYQRIRQALRESPDIRQTLENTSDEEILKRLGAADYPSPEGLFMPDTYVFVPGTTDFEVLQQAYRAQQAVLEQAWEQREPGLPLSSPYEALILASIVEKETGHGEDRGRVAGVFINRLRIGMPLQTDPTVIYGMGDRYEGRIRRADLQRDTPWNTYTRPGLPPTPIAAVSRASLEATLHPELHDFYYFVARGDGTSEFAKDLRQHNRNVAKYILGK